MEKDRQQKMTLLANMGCFGKFSGAEQVEYIESFSIRKRTSLLSKYGKEIKEDAPKFVEPFIVNKEVAEYFAQRDYPVPANSIYKQNGIRRYLECSARFDRKINVEGISFKNVALDNLNLKNTNISARQFLESIPRKLLCILPEIDFTGFSFAGKNIQGVKFGHSIITREQLLEAKWEFVFLKGNSISRSKF